MRSSRGGLVLVAAAVALCVALLGVQLAFGGAGFAPARAADPCRDRGLAPRADLDSLAQTVVLSGLDATACRLGVSREQLVLALPLRADRVSLARDVGTDERGLARALKAGMRAGVDRLDRRGRLPRASALLPAVAGQLGVPPSLVGRVPDSVVDGLLPTADVLRASVDRLDVPALLTGVDDSASLESTLRKAIEQGAIDTARARLRAVLPESLRGLFG